MPIRMIHAEHGATHVQTLDEAAEHEKLGWKKDEPAQAKESPAVQTTGTLSLRKARKGEQQGAI